MPRIEFDGPWKEATRAELCEGLLAAGARVGVSNSKGYTPLHWAAHMESEECCLALVKAGADVEARDEEGRTPLKLASSKLRKKMAVRCPSPANLNQSRPNQTYPNPTQNQSNLPKVSP